MASIKLRKNTWYAVWTQNKKQVCKTTNIKAKGDKERKLAQNAADAMEKCAKGDISLTGAVEALRKIAEVTTGVTSMPTVKDYFDQYEPNGKEQNRYNSRRAFSLFIKHLNVDAYKRLDLLTPNMCKDFFKKQLARVSFGTARHYKCCLCAALNAAVKDGLLIRNPMNSVQLHKMIEDGTKRATYREPFTLEEMATIINTFCYPWSQMALASYLTGGQRLGDIVNLKWRNIDFTKKTIHIRTMKTGKDIIVPLHPRLEQALLELYPNENEYVFPLAAQRYSRSKGSLSIEFTAMLRASGILPMQKEKATGDKRPISPKSFHSIRHTVVSQMRCNPLMTADLTRAIVGHTSEEVERQYFTAPSKAKVKAIDFLANQIAPTSSN